MPDPFYSPEQSGQKSLNWWSRHSNVWPCSAVPSYLGVVGWYPLCLGGFVNCSFPVVGSLGSLRAELPGAEWERKAEVKTLKSSIQTLFSSFSFQYGPHPSAWCLPVLSGQSWGWKLLEIHLLLI